MSDLDLWPDDEPVASVAVIEQARPAEVMLAAALDGPLRARLETLLTFVPDVALKHALTHLAAAALAEDLTTESGLQAADRAMPDIKRQVDQILLCFDGTESQPGPTRLAGMLHKRLTGLRADFTKPGTDALETLRRGVAAEARRRAAAAEEIRRAEQAEADRKAKADAKAAADEAKQAGESREIVAALNKAAKTATAAPVQASVQAPKLNTSVVDKWRVRFKGTPEDAANQQPAVGEMSEAQTEQFRRLCAAVGRGDEPVAVLAGVNWSYLDRRAGSEKLTLKVTEIEAYNEGGARVPTKVRR